MLNGELKGEPMRLSEIPRRVGVAIWIILWLLGVPLGLLLVIFLITRLF
jgi:hypothetical protein